MEILYVSRLCSEQRLSELMRDLPVKPPLQEQKFHGLLARGLASCARGVTALSVLPHQPGKGSLPSTASESEKGVAYRHLSLCMIPLLSHGIVFLWSFFATLRWILSRRGESRFVICDVLDVSVTTGAHVAAKMAGVPTIALVTDIPDILHEYIGGSESVRGRILIRAYRALSTFFMERYDGYILLTEAMNPMVNPRGRPHLVMEGMVDAGMGEVDNPIDGKLPERVVLYAGALYSKFGVGTLLEAFLRVPNPDVRLWLYGTGELAPALRDYEARDPRIHFFGVRPNQEVVAAEVRATLLVNPRPSHEAFTKFSFPSKNMEYMASGTPILTTPLPGMPEEYLRHVFTLEDESVAGMAATLTELLELPREELHRRGKEAKAFVLTCKSNLIQAGRVHAFFLSMAGVA